MMRQEINLFTQLRKPRVQSALLSWRQFWICNLLFLMALIVITIIIQANLFRLKAEKLKFSTEGKNLQAKFYAIKSHYPGLFFSENVAKTVDDLQKELVSGEKFLHNISTQIPISDYLSIFADTIPPDIWLTDIKIFNDGDNISVKGKSLATQSVQHFLEILVNEKRLDSYILNVNNIETTLKDNQPIEFEVTMVKKHQ